MFNKYYFWGAGGVGGRALGYLAPLGIISGVIDEDPGKQGGELCGYAITGYEAAKPYLKGSGVIIGHFSPKETEEILRRDGVPHYRLSEFITRWFWEKRGEHAAGFLDFPITMRCTLNCIACMQYTPRRKKRDVPIEALKRDLDALFRDISFIGEISIIGGEPFLHSRLSDILEYIGRNYRGRIGSLVITTNGTVMPDRRTLEQCRKLGVCISISDYGEALPHIEKSIEALKTAAAAAGIKAERKRWRWSDPGRFDKAVFKDEDCALEHMQLFGGKLWRCTLMAAACAAGLCEAGGSGSRDYYDLSAPGGDMHSFLDFRPAGKTSQCANCLYPKGIKIPAAAQC